MSKLVPYRSLLSPFSHWPSLWDDEDMSLLPQGANDLDVYENESEVVVKANVAGVPMDKVDVTFEKGYLWIQAKSTEEDEDKKNKYYSKASWNYSYRVGVPGDIDHAKEPEVTLEGGILKVVFAKSEASKPRKLTVKSK